MGYTKRCGGIQAWLVSMSYAAVGHSLLTKKEAIRCNGRIYSEEHRRKFDIKNDIFKVERNPTDNNKLVLTINRQPIGEWFKEQFGKLGYGFRKAPDEPRKGRVFKL